MSNPDPAYKPDGDVRRTIAVGVFDGVHAGHRMLIEKVLHTAHDSGTRPCIMTFSTHPLRLIAPERAPLMLTTVDERRKLILDCGIEEVIVLDFDENLRNLSAGDFLALLSAEYGVEHLIVGFNHHFGRDRKGSVDNYRKLASRFEITVDRAEEVLLPELDLRVSSSSVRKYLLKGNVENAAAMLTRPYSFSGTVVHGRGQGTSIGFPTANLSPLCRLKLVPKGGVYACLAEINGMRFPAVVNIGTCPTLTDGAGTTIEAHLIGLDRNLYGKDITLSFVRRLRSEKKFKSIDALRTRIALDKETAEKILNHQRIININY